MKGKRQKKFAIVGGPCSGKTDIINMLARHFIGKLVVVPEVSQALLERLMPVPGKHLTYTGDWQRHLQRAICITQQAAEDNWSIVAEQRGLRVVLCDRGLLDGAAYWEGGVMPFCDHFGLDYQEVLDRYDMVIHLQSLAVSHPELFEQLRTANGSSRFESLEDTRRLEQAVLEAWEDHPNRHVILGSDEIETKIAAVRRLIQQLVEGE